MAIMKEHVIAEHLDITLLNFKNMSYEQSDTRPLAEFRERQYFSNETYRNIVDKVHTGLSCCSFHSSLNRSNISSCHHRVSGGPLPQCTSTFQDYIGVKLTYIRCLAFMLVPIQLLCLGFDLMVLKTLQVTKEYDKLERELSNRKREKRNSMGYTALTTDVENVKLADISLGGR